MHSVAVSLLGWSAERGAGRLDAELDIPEAEADGIEVVESERCIVGRPPRMKREDIKASQWSLILETLESCLLLGGDGLSLMLIAICLLMSLGTPTMRRGISWMEPREKGLKR